MGSVGGIKARSGYVAYGLSKAALLWTTRTISEEFTPYNKVITKKSGNSDVLSFRDCSIIIWEVIMNAD